MMLVHHRVRDLFRVNSIMEMKEHQNVATARKHPEEVTLFQATREVPSMNMKLYDKGMYNDVLTPRLRPCRSPKDTAKSCRSRELKQRVTQPGRVGNTTYAVSIVVNSWGTRPSRVGEHDRVGARAYKYEARKLFFPKPFLSFKELVESKARRKLKEIWGKSHLSSLINFNTIYDNGTYVGVAVNKRETEPLTELKASRAEVSQLRERAMGPNERKTKLLSKIKVSLVEVDTGLGRRERAVRLWLTQMSGAWVRCLKDGMR
ncbi:hypothetical protein ACLOJK_014886 [Asimina triloba]